MLAGAAVAVNAAVTTQKAASFFKSFANIEAEGYFLWKLVDSVSAPLETAVKLSARHDSCAVLEPPVSLTRAVLASVEEVLERWDQDEGGRPESREGWMDWLMGKKDGLTRKEQIKDLQPKLSMALSALHAGLTTAAMRSPQLTATAPFRFIQAAVDEAYRLLQEFEFGRLPEGRVIACGNFHQFRRGEGSLWQELGPCVVWLRLQGDPARFSLHFHPTTPSPLSVDLDGESLVSWEPIALDVARGPFRIRRSITGQVTNLECAACDADNLVYELCLREDCRCLLEFESVGRLSAETFEALLVMVKLTRGGEMMLADSVDLDSSKWRDAMEREGFSFDQPLGSNA